MTELNANTDAVTAGAAQRTTPRWLSLVIAIVFGIFYVYDMWEAIGNLVGLNNAALSLDTALSGWGWSVLIGAIVLPVVVFALAYLLGRQRGALAQAVLLFVGLALVAVLTLDIMVTFGLGRLLV
ncbi:hypothetical protein [Glaciibacter psychrotolerans]|uniref:Formate-dependent nitrite reductase membrane component NrfD n=1 Tax=Glaciibacter psychrotolerans TaxID=670054 RepID=A0A7Z0J5J9_9MICO|nr:hypothetical protein [Leifsonia psychrotolerans]NYJ19567.1 formate-dependent nitrite reductase membrane component NrfD [Leifsonia psychrotolerans]